ncbi:MAG: DinB family protein [Verrucomicrobia bacterium]|nr:DinB family protein [Verrucomicrobiota bacterium]
MTTTTQRPLAEDNINILRQGINLLEHISDVVYAKKIRDCFNSCIGGHFRHTWDHYKLLLERAASGRVDYDDRTRDPEFEVSREYAIGKLNEVCDGLTTLAEDEANRRLTIKVNCGGGMDERDWSETTLKRELQFLLSHDVHHYALIAYMLHSQGVETPPEFGIAPSTLRYTERQKQCAQ